MKIKEEMCELERHNLKYDRPHIYTCSCGLVALLWDGMFSISQMPLYEVQYLACGHAPCYKTDNGCLGCSLADSV